MSESRPWDIDPVLKPNRLLLLAEIAVATRNQAFAEANFEAGDTSWGIGCKAHERFMHSVTRLAETSARGWLKVHRDGLSFTSIIEGVAVRGYRGPADRPSARHVHAAQLEVERVQRRQLSLFAEELVRDEPWAWLMAVETDDEGRAMRVVFFQANEMGERRNAWVAPLPEEQARLPLFASDAGAAPVAREARVARVKRAKAPLHADA